MNDLLHAAVLEPRNFALRAGSLRHRNPRNPRVLVQAACNSRGVSDRGRGKTRGCRRTFLYGALRRFVLVGTVEPKAAATRMPSSCRARRVPVGAPSESCGLYPLTAFSEPVQIHLCLELEA